jgi:DNA-binding CsgD family transcriptional regulator
VSFSDINIIILHSVAIIRKGLYQILYEEFGSNVFAFQNVNQWNDYQFSSNMILLIDEEYYYRHKQEILNSTINANWRKVILIKMLAGRNYMEELIFDSINFNDPESQIINTVHLCISKKKNINDEVNSNLSERENEILKNIALGLSNKEIGDKLFISIHTVISHRKNITHKLGIKSISGLAIYAVINKIIDASEIQHN